MAGLILVLGSSSNFVGGVGSRSSGGRSKKLILFLESMVEITLGHQVWVGLVIVLDLSKNCVGGQAQGQVVVWSRFGYKNRNLRVKLPLPMFNCIFAVGTNLLWNRSGYAYYVLRLSAAILNTGF